jgi:hypothetical protein
MKARGTPGAGKTGAAASCREAALLVVPARDTRAACPEAGHRRFRETLFASAMSGRRFPDRHPAGSQSVAAVPSSLAAVAG